jgi:hypothetical protein
MITFYLETSGGWGFNQYIHMAYFQHYIKLDIYGNLDSYFNAYVSNVYSSIAKRVVMVSWL